MVKGHFCDGKAGSTVFPWGSELSFLIHGNDLEVKVWDMVKRFADDTNITNVVDSEREGF